MYFIVEFSHVLELNVENLNLLSSATKIIPNDIKLVQMFL